MVLLDRNELTISDMDPSLYYMMANSETMLSVKQGSNVILCCLPGLGLNSPFPETKFKLVCEM